MTSVTSFPAGTCDDAALLGRPRDAIAINAGVGVGGPCIDRELQAELRLIDLNVSTVVHLSKYALRDMVSRGGGRVLYTSSIAAEMPGPYEAVYAASKACELSFAEALMGGKDHVVAGSTRKKK